MSDLISTRDRVRVLFAALHESGCGTFETCRLHLAMSAFGVTRKTYAPTEFFSVWTHLGR